MGGVWQGMVPVKTAERVAMMAGVLVASCACAFALNPSLDISQYAHTAWTIREGFFKGNLYSIAQTPDGYLWVGTEFGLVRFDGVRAVPWQPPAGQRLPDNNIHRLLAARDGTLWMGTFRGLVSWDGANLKQYPEVGQEGVAALVEDREGTVWAGGWGYPHGRLCAIRGGRGECYGQDGAFGKGVMSLYEGSSGALWAGGFPGLWRWKPGPPRRYAAPAVQLSGLSETGDGKLLLAVNGGGLMQLAGDKAEPYPIRAATNSAGTLRDSEVNSNKLLRDRDGGIWIGAVARGLIHLHNGRTDVFTRSDGLSGDVIFNFLEDREGNIWVTTAGGLDRFRELPVTTVSAPQGLSSAIANSVLAAADGSIWVATGNGLNRLKNERVMVFRKSSGLPDDNVHSLFQDYRGRIWVSTPHGLAYYLNGRFVGVIGAPDGETYSITGDNSGNLWLSQEAVLSHLLDGRFIERIPWQELGRHQQAKIILPEQGGLWLSFWTDGGVSYFKDRKLRGSYTAADGLGQGHVPGLRLDRGGALWASTEDGGLSRIKDGRVATLTARNGLPCDTIHWSMEDDDGSLWLYTACGLVRIARTAVDAWIADPKHRIEPAVWDAADGVRLRSVAPSGYSPTVAKSSDGRLWFVAGEGVQMVDPRNLPVNPLPPPVHIEQVKADGKPYPLQKGIRLPAKVRDVSIEYTALSLVAPEKVHFKYMLEGQDPDWKEVVNERRAQYSNLRPRTYRFRVIACNNSGVWNKTGDTLELSVDPMFYQTAWFGAACLTAFLAVAWGLHRLRLRRLAREFNARIEERVQERTRIARDLHDTLLQSVQGLMFSFQAARNLLPERAEDAVRTLDEAIREGDEAIAESRDAIQGLRADPGLERDLERMLTGLGKELAKPSGAEGEPPAFQVTVEGSRQPLSPLLQDEVYRMVREFLRNAFRHARASRIEAEIAYDRRFFRVRIRDNGTGIDPKVLEQGARQGHWGLPGVRERAKRVGARLSLWSEPGAGTEAELTIPARIAYAKADRDTRLRWFARHSPGTRSKHGRPTEDH
jgi:signal transduction histidine kinase/ligand-binding sensor domain-containing protein